ncbi:MAG TPA: response regulator [Dongiaceae bacterium]|nr:response regulator [Dongiaceae bacterium]
MKSILVIDDDPLVGTTVQRILTSANWDVRLARNGRDALDQVAQRAPDLVVTDIIMPDMEGLEIISSLQRSHPDIPIIAVSGSGRMNNVDYLAYAEKLGAYATLAKPFKREEILRIIRKAFGEASDS